MIINNIDIISINKELNNPLINSKRSYYKQAGFYIILNSDKFDGKGEISLLDGFSCHTSQDVLWAYESFKLCFPINENLHIDEYVSYVNIHLSNFPSMIFAFETALYDIYCQKLGTSIASCFNKKNANIISLSTMFSADDERMPYFDTVKYKIGVNDLSKDLAVMNNLNSKKTMQFRLDANQSLELKDFLFIDKNKNNLNIQYIEEPYQNLNENKLKELKSKTSFKIAIDDSVYKNELYKDWIKKNLIDYLIIKPSIFGGYTDFFNLVNYSSSYNIPIILSSSLETHVGHMACMNLASYLNNNMKHGLDYYSFYNDSSKYIFPKHNSIIDFRNIVGLGVDI